MFTNKDILRICGALVAIGVLVGAAFVGLPMLLALL